MILNFYLSIAILAILLFFPVSKMIWTLSVRRMQRKLARQLADEEIKGQKTRAKFISVIVVLLFSWFFNTQLQNLLNG